MKRWPEKNKTVNFPDLVDPVKKAILFAYDIKRKNDDKDIPWSGYNIGKDDAVTCFSPKEELEIDNLRFIKEDQGRDALDIILGIAIRLGIEQGRRINKIKTERSLCATELAILDAVKKILERSIVK